MLHLYQVQENILNGNRVMKRTRKVNGRMDGRAGRQTDGRTDGGHDIIRPVFDGRISKSRELLRADICFQCKQKYYIFAVIMSLNFVLQKVHFYFIRKQHSNDIEDN